MDVLIKIKLYKEQIDLYIKKRLNEFLVEYGYLDKLGSNDGFQILSNFAISGKSIRGSLFLLFAEIYHYPDIQKLIPLAGAIEILHSSILIQDDVMDNDSLRRGKPAVHLLYENNAKKRNILANKNYGQHMAVLLGDMGFYITNRTILETDLDPQTKCAIFDFISKQLISTNLGQMADINIGLKSDNVSLKVIEKIQELKTAYYTFYIPINIAYLAAKQNDENSAFLNKELSILWGRIFQITDDLIDFMSDEKESGKNIGSDIKNNKKTYIRDLLFKKLRGKDLEFVKRSFNNQNLTQSDILKVRKIYHLSNCSKMMQDMISKLQKKAFSVIYKMNLPQNLQKCLLDFTLYLSERTR